MRRCLLTLYARSLRQAEQSIRDQGQQNFHPELATSDPHRRSQEAGTILSAHLVMTAGHLYQGDSIEKTYHVNGNECGVRIVWAVALISDGESLRVIMVRATCCCCRLRRLPCKRRMMRSEIFSCRADGT